MMTAMFGKDAGCDERTMADRQHELTASIAHDLCNHLQVISCALNILRRSVGNGSVNLDAVFDGARCSLERAVSLGRSIVDSGQVRCRPVSRTSIAGRIEALTAAMRLAGGPETRIELLISDDVPDVLCASEDLDDVILNIVVNAGRAMPDGGRLSISLHREDLPTAPLPNAVLRIADTGCGMPREVADRAFERGFSTRTKGEGSGIGLAMVADFIEASRGSVHLVSSVGVGTAITIRLPGLLKAVNESRPRR